MRISYTGPRGSSEDAKGDALWIVLREGVEYDESEEIAEDVVAHYGADGGLISIEVYAGASEKVNLARLDLEGLAEVAREAHYA